jgi:hypothetical protein
MTLRSAILAAGPTTYWPLDEPSGPTAFDVSGHGNNGQYQSPTIFQVPGPEAGTFAVGSNAFGGGVIRNGLPIFGNIAQSYVMMCALNPGQASADNQSFGGGANGGARGIALTINPSSGLAQWLFLGAAVFSTGLTASIGAWHLYFFSWDPAAGGTSHAQIDNGSYVNLTGHAPGPSLTGDQLIATPPGGSGIAHFAEFNYVLTSGQVNNIVAGAVGLQAWPGGGGAVTPLNLLGIQANIQSLIAGLFRDFKNTP